MSAQSQDSISLIENALVTMRRDQQLRRLQRRDHGSRGPGHRDRSLGGAARMRMLDALVGTGGMSVSDIAHAIGVDQPRASRLVNDAVEHSFARRMPDPLDGRRSVIELTEAGRRMLESAHENRRAAVTQAISTFTPHEVETFADLLSRFVTDWPRD